jgi:transcriptional/translational regulatory protein YebC/TACO1
MGAQWKQAGREAAALKKGQVVGKLVREIMVAAKLGGAEVDTNARLAVAVDKWKKASVTRAMYPTYSTVPSSLRATALERQ